MSHPPTSNSPSSLSLAEQETPDYPHPTPRPPQHVHSDRPDEGSENSTVKFERDIPFAPTFYPSEEDMKDVFSYIRQHLMEPLKQHGIVRVRPPVSVSLNNIEVDFEKSTISTTMQRLGSLDGTSRLRLREKNGITLFVTSRNTGISPKCLIDSPETRMQNEQARTRYQDYVRSCHERGSLYRRLPASHEKICLVCNKSIKRERKIKCLLCPRQFHLCCLPVDSHPWMNNVWYCDHCICFPVETFFNRSFAYPIVTTPVNTSNTQANSGRNDKEDKNEEMVDAIEDESNEIEGGCCMSPRLNPMADKPPMSARIKVNWSDNGPCVSMSQLRDASERLHNQIFSPEMTPSHDQMEQVYWNYLDDEYNSTEVMFTSGLLRDDQIIDYIHRTPKYSDAAYNLATLRNHPDSLLKREQSAGDIGILSGPWFPSGMMFSTVPWHIEDHFLFSLSWLHVGSSRMWYSVPGEKYEAFEHELQTKMGSLFDKERKLLNHYFTMYNPYRLPTSLPVYKVAQELGDIIVMFPKAYHSAFNFGFSITEAIDIAAPEWLPYGMEATRAYLDMRRKPLLNVLDLIIGFLSCTNNIGEEERANKEQHATGNFHRSSDNVTFRYCMDEVERLLMIYFIQVPVQLSTFNQVMVKNATRKSGDVIPVESPVEVCDMPNCYQYVKHISWHCAGCDGFFCGACISIIRGEDDSSSDKPPCPSGKQVFCPICQPDILACYSKAAALSLTSPNTYESLSQSDSRDMSTPSTPYDPSSLNLFGKGHAIKVPDISAPTPHPLNNDGSHQLPPNQRVRVRLSEKLSSLINRFVKNNNDN